MRPVAPVPPLLLSFSESDPVAAAGLQADLLAGASLGCHVLGVLTALAVRDSTGAGQRHAFTPDLIDAQARSLLEDVSVRAFKVGALYGPEAVSVIAQILADYADVPLVLHLTDVLADDDDLAEDTLSATLALLVPHARVAVVNHASLERWWEDGILPRGECSNAIEALLAHGADHVLVTAVPRGHEDPVNVLAGDAPEAEAWAWRRLPGKYLGAGATLSAALAAGLAQGLGVREAVIDAQRYTQRSLECAFVPGMGQALPDRLFWRAAAAEESA